MTIDERIIVDFSDIKTIGLECTQCHSKITLDPRQAFGVPHTCAQCRHTWLPTRNDEYVTVRLLAAIADYLKHQKEGHSDGFSVRLEFDATKLSASRALSGKG